jgi:hypothetical protein
MTQPPQWQPQPEEPHSQRPPHDQPRPPQQPPYGQPGPPQQPLYGQQPAHGQQYGGQYPQPTPGQPPPGYPGAPTTSEERNWALGAHLGSFLAAYVGLGLFAPLLVLLVKGNDSGFIRRHAVESLNFQINALVYIILFVILAFVLIGFVLLPLYGIFYLVVVILASVRASRGEEYRYPLTIRVIS